MGTHSEYTALPACVTFMCVLWLCITARSVEDETRNGDRNANRNPKRNHETTVSWLFSYFQAKRDREQYLHDSV